MERLSSFIQSGGHLWQNLSWMWQFCLCQKLLHMAYRCTYISMYTIANVLFAHWAVFHKGLLEGAAILYSIWIHLVTDRCMLWHLTGIFSLLFLLCLAKVKEIRAGQVDTAHGIWNFIKVWKKFPFAFWTQWKSWEKCFSSRNVFSIQSHRGCAYPIQLQLGRKGILS